MAEFNRLPTQEELSRMIYQMRLGGRSEQDIINENLASGSTIKALPENLAQKMATGAGVAKKGINDFGAYLGVPNLSVAAQKMFPGYTGESQVKIPTGYNFGVEQMPSGEIKPQGLQTQPMQLNQLLQAIKPADLTPIPAYEKIYGDIGAGKAPNPMDVAEVAATAYIPAKAGMAASKGLLNVAEATKGLPVGMSIQDVSKAGLLAQAPKSDIGFYSAVEQAVINTPRKQGAGQAFLNDISKGQDVRADEIKWMGLDDYLKNKQNVTKQEVQDYIANNRVDIQEVKSTIPRLPGEEMPGDKGAFLPKFAKYQLPGGENYRELVLTMPNKNMGVLDTAQIEAGSLRKQTTDLMADWKAISEAMPGSPEAVAAYGKVAESRKLMNEAEKSVDVMKSQMKEETYFNTHFPDQKNTLAHLRVNDRVDADGKKMLLIEEVQSDWHQAGRDKGYAKNVKDELDAIQKQMSDLGDQRDPVTNRMVNEDQWFELGKKKDELVKQSKGVPDAPFKDTWYQLALKRAIQHAAENGYDRIGLTTGSQQIKRYPDEKNVKGMEKYYDEIYPKFLDKYGKKWNARIGNTTVPTDRDTIGGMPSMYPNQEPVRYIDITPEMKAGVSKGQPLFTAAPIAAGGGLLGAQEERK